MFDFLLRVLPLLLVAFIAGLALGWLRFRWRHEQISHHDVDALQRRVDAYRRQVNLHEKEIARLRRRRRRRSAIDLTNEARSTQSAPPR